MKTTVWCQRKGEHAMTHVRLSSRVPPGSSTHLSEGILSETLDDGQLVVFTFLNLAISTVDSAMEALDALLRRCDEAGRPLRLLLDLSAPEPILTPYAREQGASLSRLRPRLRGRVALVAQEGSPIAHRLDRFLRSELYHYRERSMFFQRDQALVWLRETLDHQPPG